ncbi:hypothetical protein BPAE_0085g00450 [Botrytis paeoniae]|uniref:Uncharacterized protein n=1 Tax=Botrytis paeoniae TaxID=278948 RepID=A0A4Z1FQT1_9HELO|nr:hypothetical protein BPAE_0085g00450 [Botrytis paeoniae]
MQVQIPARIFSIIGLVMVDGAPPRSLVDSHRRHIKQKIVRSRHLLTLAMSSEKPTHSSAPCLDDHDFEMEMQRIGKILNVTFAPNKTQGSAPGITQISRGLEDFKLEVGRLVQVTRQLSGRYSGLFVDDQALQAFHHTCKELDVSPAEILEKFQAIFPDWRGGGVE